jgi:hypothetical protein
LGVTPTQLFEQVRFWICTRKKVPDGEDVIANMQDACDSQKVARSAFECDAFSHRTQS